MTDRVTITGWGDHGYTVGDWISVPTRRRWWQFWEPRARQWRVVSVTNHDTYELMTGEGR